jgi:hypothetical protein
MNRRKKALFAPKRQSDQGPSSSGQRLEGPRAGGGRNWKRKIVASLLAVAIWALPW